MIDVQFFEVFDEQAYSVLLCVGAIAGAVLIESAGRKFRRVSAKYTGRISACGLSGKQVAQRLLATAGVTDVDVKSGGKKDVYSPWQKEIQLTAATASSPSICALATAAHEVGHAQQFAEDYAPARWWRQVSPYAFWLPVLVILAIPAALFGWIDLSLTTISWAAPLLFVVLVAVQLPIHLPLERNASRRARKWVQQQNLVTTDELPIFDELLHSAWKTHVAAQCGQWIMVGAVVAVVCLAPSYFLPLETVSPPLGAGGEGWLVAVPPDFEAPQQPVEIPENPFLEILFSGGFLLLWGIAGFTALVFLSKVKDLTTYEPTLEEQAVELNNAGRKLQVAGIVNGRWSSTGSRLKLIRSPPSFGTIEGRPILSWVDLTTPAPILTRRYGWRPTSSKRSPAAASCGRGRMILTGPGATLRGPCKSTRKIMQPVAAEGRCTKHVATTGTPSQSLLRPSN